MGLATVTGLARKGWFIPYRHAPAVPPRPGAPYAALERVFAAARPDFEAAIAAMEAHWPALRGFAGAAPPAPRWEQSWYPGLDGAMAYALTRDRAPARIVEVGSGHSTRFLARAIADGGLATRIIAIDPAPRADISSLAPVAPIRATLQEAGLDPFQALGAGDMLVIDSSHILMPGSDVDILFNRVLPALPAGVLVHVHDVTLPDDYPGDWTWRGYNEQAALGPLIGRGGARLVWAGHYARTRMADRIAGGPLAGLSVPPGARETALWFELR